MRRARRCWRSASGRRRERDHKEAIVRLTRATLLAAALAVSFGPGPTWAQSASDWPSRPVRLVVPASAGGVADAVARLLGEALAKRLGQPVVIDNVAGAASLIGTAAV